MSVYIDNFETIFGVKNNIQALRNKVLELAIQGKLVEQDLSDEPASELVKKIQAERDKLVKEGKKKRQKLLAPICEEDISSEIPNNWACAKLGSVAENIKGVTFNKSDAKKENILNYDLILRGGNIHSQTEKLLFEDNLYIPKGIVKDDQYLQNGDTILVASSGTKSSIAKSAFINEQLKDTSVGAFLFIIRPIKVEPLFIRYLLKYFRQRIIDDTSGTNISNVGKDQLDNFIIPLPPLAEQHRIVNKIEFLMSEIDKLDESLQKKEHLMKLIPKAVVDAIGSCQTGEELKEQLQFAIENFETVFQTPESMQELRYVVLQLAIEGKLVPQDDNDEPASKLVKRIEVEKDKLGKEGKIKKQQPLALIEENEIPFEIPESWEWMRLGDVISITSGDGLTKKDMAESGQYPVYGGNGITGYHNCCNIEEETIVIGRVGFYCGSIHLTPTNSWVTDNAFRITYPKQSINRDWLIQTLKTMDLGKNDNATAQPVISQTKIYPLLIPIPPQAEQYRIVQRVESIMSLIDQIENGLKRKVDLAEKMASI